MAAAPPPEENSLKEEEKKTLLHNRADKVQIKLREERDARTLRTPSTRERSRVGSS